jgi:hypothetical protein
MTQRIECCLDFANALFGVASNLIFGQPKDCPAVIGKPTVFLSVTPNLTGERVPVNAIALNDQHGAGDSKINGVITDLELRGNDHFSLCEGAEHSRFKATDTGHGAAAEFRGATPRAGAVTVAERVLNHANSAAHFARHRIGAALVVVPLGSRQRGFELIVALFGAVDVILNLSRSAKNNCAAHLAGVRATVVGAIGRAARVLNLAVARVRAVLVVRGVGFERGIAVRANARVSHGGVSFRYGTFGSGRWGADTEVCWSAAS